MQGPQAEHILVRPLAEVERPGAMILPDTQQERPRAGIVVAVGPGKVVEGIGRVPCTLEVGEHVCFPGYAGQGKALLLDLGTGNGEEELMVLREDEVYYSHGLPQTLTRCAECGAHSGTHFDSCEQSQEGNHKQ